MTQKHTKTPWKIITKNDKYGKEQLIAHDCGNGSHIVICGAPFEKEDAALIVRAVNHHDELVEKLKAFVDCGYIDLASNDWIYEEARAILAKVQS